jgi:hypothetical protein
MMTGEVQFNKRILEAKGEDMCWICEQWIEAKINVDLMALDIPFEKPEDIDEPI